MGILKLSPNPFVLPRLCLQYYKTCPYDEDHEFKLQIKPALISHFYQKYAHKPLLLISQHVSFQKVVKLPDFPEILLKK